MGSSILLTLGAANYYGPGDQAFSTTGYRLRQFTGGVEKSVLPPLLIQDQQTLCFVPLMSSFFTRSELETKQGMKVEKLGNDDDAFVKFTNVGKVKDF